jgi:hypothetical protein
VSIQETEELCSRYICTFPQRRNFELVSIDKFAGGYLLADSVPSGIPVQLDGKSCFASGHRSGNQCVA